METKLPSTQSMEDAIKHIISKYDNPEREGLIETPKRYIKALDELLTAEPPKIKMFSGEGYNQMIIESGIQYYTFCEHHILPFFGEVKIGYIPDKYIIGLSKLSRIVNYFSKRLNTQERLTENICLYLWSQMKPQGIGVMVNGRHLCKEMRGAKAKGIMRTTSLRGIFNDEKVKMEFLKS